MNLSRVMWAIINLVLLTLFYSSCGSGAVVVLAFILATLELLAGIMEEPKKGTE